MKKILFFSLAAAMLCAAGCQKYDDSVINSRIDSLEERLSAVETVMSAYENNLTITSVEKTTSGYVITFSDGSKVTITNGKNGTDGKDGQNGVDGKDGQDGNDGQNGVDGKDGKDGADGDTLIDYISITDEGVTFKLTDGREFSIPFEQEVKFAINFDTTEIAILEGGQSTTISYTITGATENTIVKALTQDGWKAQVKSSSKDAGTITITAPDPIVESEILVWVNDGSYRTLMVTINCVKGEINIAQSSFSIDSEGGEQTIKLTTNVNFIVDIPASAQSWISLIETRAMRDESLTFHIAANDGLARFATISLKDSQDNILQTIGFNQLGEITEVNVETKGSLEKELKDYDYAKIKSLKISGVLNDVDFLFIYRMMPNLRNLDISDIEITTLPTRAFYQSKNVENIILPNTLTVIGERMFYQSNLKSVFIPKSVEIIEQSAFNGSALISVVFEKGAQLKTYYYGAFSYCASLVSIEIPASVETIEAAAFKGCSSLKTVTFEKGSHLKTIGGGYYSYDYDSYSYYGAFSDCPITSIEIPASVETIEAAAFLNCSSLKTVTFEENSHLKTIGGGYYGAFSGCPITSIEIPASVETIEAAAFKGCSQLRTVTFENGSQLKTIGGGYYDGGFYDYSYGAFSGCPITSIKIPASVETIEAAAFKGCSSLKTVTFEENSHLKTIGGGYYNTYYYGAFSGCASLVSIEIPASVETIEAAAFLNCSSLKTVTFEENSHLKTIGGHYFHNNYFDYSCGAFSNLSNLRTVDMSGCTQVESIGQGAFYNDKELSLFKIGTSTPPICEDVAFLGIPSSSVLKVPSGCADAYKTESGWENFANISGFDE